MITPKQARCIILEYLVGADELNHAAVGDVLCGGLRAVGFGDEALYSTAARAAREASDSRLRLGIQDLYLAEIQRLRAKLDQP